MQVIVWIWKNKKDNITSLSLFVHVHTRLFMNRTASLLYMDEMMVATLKSNGVGIKAANEQKLYLKINNSSIEHIHNGYATVQVSLVCQKHTTQVTVFYRN